MTSQPPPTFLLLGPLEVNVENRPIALGGLRQKALLALLLLRPNEIVSRDRLIDELWGEHPPERAANALAALVVRLRRVLPAGTVVTRAGGYEAQIEQDEIDLYRFERLRQEGDAALAAHDPAAAAELFRSGLSLWRGPPLDDFRYESFAGSAILRLEELRLAALESRVDADAALGRHGELVGELQSLVLEYPLRERFRAQLMGALYASGRQAEALEAYGETRRFLLEELGIDPSPALKELHRAILRQDESFRPPDRGPIEAQPPAPSAPRRGKERKIVTVLTAGLADAPSDPEDLEEVLGPFRARFGEEVDRYGGVVHDALGAVLLAVFGMPAAHEDDPERAVRVALELRDWAHEWDQLAVWLGVATGEALVGAGTVTGEIVDTAARIKAVGIDVLVDEATFRASRRVIDYRAYGEGLWEPAQIAALGVDVRQGGGSQLVGRTRELDALVDAQTRSAAERSAQLVTVVGVPGIGKSRLIWELSRRLDATWRQGRCLPYGEGVTMWALGEIVKAQAGILESDGGDETAAKLAGAVGAVVSDERDARWIVGHLGPLVGLGSFDASSRDRGGEAFAAWRQFFEALADEGPLVLVFEDLHWADDRLLDFVEYLAEWTTDVPLSIVATTRPELLERRPTWGGGKLNATTISLAPLAVSETARLLDALLGEASEELLERAAGNPLYAEEFARLTLEGRRLELPETVQGIIGARLDELSSAEKEVLQAAAVIGKVFWPGSVAAITGATEPLADLLHRLELKQFVRRDRRSSVASEVEYAFRHVLTRDIAYGRLPRSARVDAHRAAAEWLESLGRPDDHAEMLAYHYVEALELGGGTGTVDEALRTRACEMLRRAGERALALNAFAAAVRFLAAAIEHQPEEHEKTPLLLAYGRALHQAGDERRLTFLSELEAHLRTAGETVAAALVDSMLAEAHYFRGESDLLDERIIRATQLLGGAPDSPEKARVLAMAARYDTLRTRFDSAAAAAREALAIAERLDLIEVQASALGTLAMLPKQAGIEVRDERGVQEMERAVELARSIRSPEELRALQNLSAYLWDLGDGERWRQARTEYLRVLDRYGSENMWRGGAVARRVELLLADRDWDAALPLLEQRIIDHAEQPSITHGEDLARRAQIRLARDDPDGSLADVRQLIEFTASLRDPQNIVGDLGAACRILVELGRLDQACALAARLRPVLDGRRRMSFVSDIAWVAGNVGLTESVESLLRRNGDFPRRRALTAVVRQEWHEAADALAAMGFLPHDEAEARLRAARASAAIGDLPEAERQLEQALAFYRSVGATRYIRQAEEVLAARV